MDPIMVMPGVLRYAQRLVGVRPMPRQADICETIQQMEFQRLALGLALDGPAAPWTPPPWMGRCTSLSWRQHEGQTRLWATDPDVASEPPGLVVGLDESRPGASIVTSVGSLPQSSARASIQ
jgi:hypothetical protein